MKDEINEIKNLQKSIDHCLDLMSSVSDNDAESVLLSTSDMFARPENDPFSEPFLNFDIFKGQGKMTDEEKEAIIKYKKLMFCLQQSGLSE